MEKTEKNTVNLNKPQITTEVTISKDKNWMIHKTTITSFTSMNYFKKVLGSN